MWFNIIKADGPTQDDIERLKAIRYKSEEDKRKIREYEKEKLIEQLREDLDKTTTLAQTEIAAQETLNQQLGLASQGKYQIYIH